MKVFPLPFMQVLGIGSVRVPDVGARLAAFLHPMEPLVIKHTIRCVVGGSLRRVMVVGGARVNQACCGGGAPV